jgi:hypothetical protein
MSDSHLRWTGEEIKRFIELYPVASLDTLTEEFHLSKSSLNSAAHRYGVKRKRQFVYDGVDRFHNFYTKDENDYIKENYLIMSDEEIAEVLGRSSKSVKNHRNEMSLHRQNRKNTLYENVSIYIRRHNVQWKKDSMEKCNFKCVVTGERFDEIHHLVSLNTIIDAVYKKLSIDKEQFDINKIDEKSKQAFLEEFYKEQRKYPLGVCLRKDIHMQFHNMYKYGDNTIQQFYDFIKEFYPEVKLDIL